MYLALILALSAETGAAVAQPPLPPAVAEIVAESSEILLAGERLPPDYRLRLLNLPPEERLMAIIYLRRVGLLTGEPFSLDDLLRIEPRNDRDEQ